jgi:predicted adenine nucleotide alpha hydrolase (AANH) superfamily ATPase
VNSPQIPMGKAQVLDITGRQLSPCSLKRARRLLQEGGAILVSEEPFTIQLPREVELPSREEPAQTPRPGEGKSILLHTCCGPCSTYTIDRLRQQGFEVTGLWYNPNIHPYWEHQRRLASMENYAESVGLPLLREANYEMVQFLRMVAGRERHGVRCGLCYRMRLERTAEVAAFQGFDAFTTTLLISPHQDQTLLRQIGESIAGEQGVDFYFENFRRGWSERGRKTREHDLYRQQYCGCVYSEWERYAGAQVDQEVPGKGDD